MLHLGSVRCALRRNSVRPRLEALEIRANPSHTLTVDDDGAQFPHADFKSIQAAVNAASPGDHIRVYAGNYHEQVIIPSKLNNLDIVGVGDHDKVRVAPTNFAADPTTEAVFHVAGAHNVSIRGFLITGADAPAGPGQGANYGVLVDMGGTADVEMNHITTIRDIPLSGTQEGIGIQYGFTNSKGTVLSNGGGEADNNVIEDYQKGGVVVIGNGSNAEVDHNTIIGQGPTAVIAQNGIQISNDAKAEVDHNDVSGNNYTAGGVVSVGILVFQTKSVEVDHNTTSQNNCGILLYFADNNDVEHNTSINNTMDGIGLFQAKNNEVEHNSVTNNKRDGINIDTSSNNEIDHNSAFFNGRYGIALESTATGNEVEDNQLGNNGVDDLFIGNPNNDVDNNHIHNKGGPNPV